MLKLSKTEIILIFGVVAVVFYGIYDLTGTTAKPNRGADKKSSDIKSLITNITAGLPSELDSNIVARAETRWQNDPFYEKKIYKERVSPKFGKKIARVEVMAEVPEPKAEVKIEVPEQKAEVKIEIPEPKVNFNYTGYLELGNKKIAIINGAEYEEDEQLETERYILKRISMSNIVIEDKLRNKEIDILLQE